MTWIAVELRVNAGAAELFADALLEAGALSVDVSDAAAGTEDEQPIFAEPGADTGSVWGCNRLVALFDSGTDIGAALQQAAGLSGIEAPPAWTSRAVQEQDWVRLTQCQFDPIQITQRLWIVPSWSDAPDPNAINIVVDPGLAFGTGSHPTTHLCLEWLARNMQPQGRVIDYGCGSGILAIAAARLGAKTVVGVDIDARALDVSHYNADRNGVKLELISAQAPPPAPADVVLANILSGPLRALAPLLANLTLPRGCLVLSGILPPQADALAALYSQWFDMGPRVERQGWVRLEGVRRPA